VAVAWYWIASFGLGVREITKAPLGNFGGFDSLGSVWSKMRLTILSEAKA
jgi:hypothetical protein